MKWSKSLLYLLLSIYWALAQNATDIPVVEDVVAVPGANPEVAVVYWKPLTSMDERIAMFIVYYMSNSTGEQEQTAEAVRLANSVFIENLKIGHHYSFTVAVRYFSDGGNILPGPRSEVTANSNITTGLNLDRRPSDDDDENSGVGALVFYGCLLFLSLFVNLVLLIMNFVLLKHLRMKYHMGSNSSSVDEQPIELKGIRNSKRGKYREDVPRKPAREHLPSEVYNEMYTSDGKCSPAKEAEVEEL